MTIRVAGIVDAVQDVRAYRLLKLVKLLADDALISRRLLKQKQKLMRFLFAHIIRTR